MNKRADSIPRIMRISIPRKGPAPGIALSGTAVST
jgi:hypothetical protein